MSDRTGLRVGSFLGRGKVRNSRLSNELSYISIGAIKAKLDNFLKQIETEDFIPFFESMKDCYFNGLYSRSKPPLRVKQISKIEDLEKIPNQRGFYLIFTDYKLGFGERNKCKAVISDHPDAKAIYRGESHNVRTRLESHLFNNTYHKKLKSDLDRYTVCLKIDGEHVNLDEPLEMAKARWYVAYHGFPNSNQVIRETAERAFDKVFNKPIFSKDKSAVQKRTEPC